MAPFKGHQSQGLEFVVGVAPTNHGLLFLAMFLCSGKTASGVCSSGAPYQYVRRIVAVSRQRRFRSYLSLETDVGASRIKKCRTRKCASRNKTHEQTEATQHSAAYRSVGNRYVFCGHPGGRRAFSAKRIASGSSQRKEGNIYNKNSTPGRNPPGPWSTFSHIHTLRCDDDRVIGKIPTATVSKGNITNNNSKSSRNGDA